MGKNVKGLAILPLVLGLAGCFGIGSGNGPAVTDNGHDVSGYATLTKDSLDDLKAACLAARGSELEYALAALGEASHCSVVRSGNDETYYYLWTRDESYRPGGNPFFGILGTVRGSTVVDFAAGGTCVTEDGSAVLCTAAAKPYVEALERLKNPEETLRTELDEKLQRFIDADVSVAAAIFGDPVTAEAFAKKGKDPSWAYSVNGQNAVITMKTQKKRIRSVRWTGSLLPAMHFLRLMNAVTLVPLDTAKQGKSGAVRKAKGKRSQVTPRSL